MAKKTKWIGVFSTLIFMLTLVFNNIPVKAAKATVIPKVQFVTVPTQEYNVGDRIRFDINSPNYSGKVEYRVVLWDDNKKQTRDLWNPDNGFPGRYYTNWRPTGKSVFNLGWPIYEAGWYRITVYVKRVGVPASKTYYPSYGCDGYKESIAFYVKPNLSVLDKDGQAYGGDAQKVLVVKNDVKLTGKSITLSNANVEGSLYITGNNSTVKNVNVTGNIVVDPGKDGIADLEKVKANKIEVLSGAKDSIHIKDVTAQEMNVASQNPVRIEADGDTEIVETTANGYVIFDKKNGSFGTITISKNEKGENSIEFRGDIKDKVVVEAQATITTSQGSKVNNLVVAAENPENKIVLKGNFDSVEVSKPSVLQVAAGTAVGNVEVKAEAKVNIEKGANVGTLDKNNNNVPVDNQGSIQKEENTGSTPAVTPTVPPVTPTVPPVTPTVPPVTPPTGGVTPPPTPVRVTGISLDAVSGMIKIGGQMQLAASILPTNADNKGIEWTSSKNSVAKVDGQGNVTGIGAGTAVVTAKTNDGNFTASANITVTNYGLSGRVVRNGNRVTITVMSDNLTDTITILVVDGSGSTQYLNQLSTANGTAVFETELAPGSYKVSIKGISTAKIDMNI